MKIVEKYFSEIEKCVNDFNITLENLQSSYSNELLYTQAIREYKKLFLIYCYDIRTIFISYCSINMLRL